MSAPEVTGGDIDAATALAMILDLDFEHIMPLAEFRAVARHEGRMEAAVGPPRGA